MNKILLYSLGVLCCVQASVVQAIEKFEILPDLPDPLAYAVQPAQATSIAGSTNDLTNIGAQSIGNEPSIVSVIFSLAIVVLLIYLTGIIYARLNKVGFRAIRKQHGELAKSQVAVISTTPLGSNKTLHVVELDGKRMLIGASSNAIQLIKDLGNCSSENSDGEYSHIEIPNIKIPKIEIPKIEIPSINFSKLVTKTHKNLEDIENEKTVNDSSEVSNSKDIEHTEINESSDGIIDSLFSNQTVEETEQEERIGVEHIVDPDDYALYKKYLG